MKTTKKWDKIKSDLDFLCTNHKIKYKKQIEETIHTAFIILEYLETKTLQYNKNLLKEINASIKLFELVNKYEPNRGYKKLAKQANLLKIQYEKYKTDEKMKSGLNDFFDDYSGERVPSREHILTLTAHNIKQILIIKDNIKRNKAKNIADSIVKIILNNDKKFIKKMIKNITIKIDKKSIEIQYIYKDYWTSQYL